VIPLKDNLPSDRLPVVTLLLIAANVVVWFAVEGGGLGHGPDAEPTLASVLFAHVSLLHLLVDLLFLWLFGSSLEDSMARWRYLLLYLVGGLAGVGLAAAAGGGSELPAIGATGAIAALLGGYLLLYPRARIVSVGFAGTFFTLFELPVWIMLAAWPALQALVDATAPAGALPDGALWLAQLGGALIGLIAVRPLADRRKRVPLRVKVAA